MTFAIIVNKFLLVFSGISFYSLFATTTTIWFAFKTVKIEDYWKYFFTLR